MDSSLCTCRGWMSRLCWLHALWIVHISGRLKGPPDGYGSEGGIHKVILLGHNSGSDHPIMSQCTLGYLSEWQNFMPSHPFYWIIFLMTTRSSFYQQQYTIFPPGIQTTHLVFSKACLFGQSIDIMTTIRALFLLIPIIVQLWHNQPAQVSFLLKKIQIWKSKGKPSSSLLEDSVSSLNMF